MSWKRVPKMTQFWHPRTSNIELALKREHDSHFFSMTPKSHQNNIPNDPIWHPKITTIGSKGHPVTILDPLGKSKKETYFWTYFLTPKSDENDSKKWGGLPQAYVLYLPSRTLPSIFPPKGDPYLIHLQLAWRAGAFRNIYIYIYIRGVTKGTGKRRWERHCRHG